jgi:hypothetical protein
MQFYFFDYVIAQDPNIWQYEYFLKLCSTVISLFFIETYATTHLTAA